jgi:regulatory protein
MARLGAAPSSLSLKGRALKYLAAREHSRVELHRKLAPHAESAEAIDQVLDELEARGFLSAERFVQSVLHRRAGRYGAARVQAELAQHRLPAELTQAARQQLRETELSRAQLVWARRFGQPPATPEERARQSRFLAGRGFSGDVIRTVLKSAMADAEVDADTHTDAHMDAFGHGGPDSEFPLD